MCPAVSGSNPPEKLPESRFAPLASPRTTPYSRVNKETVWEVSEKSQVLRQMAVSLIVGMGSWSI